MAEPISCRLLVEPEPNTGAWNMAVDEALLEAALARNECFVRWYRWSEATISLGYFQDAGEAAVASSQLAGLAMVRRLSGGGAILHHHELTYSCVVPATHRLAKNPHMLYAEVHDAIIRVLRRYGIAAHRRGAESSRQVEPFLCFGRRDARDVVLRGHKILGSAQRRRRGAILQHGSLLLHRSPFAPQHTGLCDLCSATSFDHRRATELAWEIGSILHHNLGRGELDEEARLLTRELQRTRYGSVDWRQPAARVGKSTKPPSLL